jgi:hypothetical protein
MFRTALYALGFSAALTAFMIYNEKKNAKRPVPAKRAAEMLRQAWADYRTRA